MLISQKNNSMVSSLEEGNVIKIAAELRTTEKMKDSDIVLGL